MVADVIACTLITVATLLFGQGLKPGTFEDHAPLHAGEQILVLRLNGEMTLPVENQISLVETEPTAGSVCVMPFEYIMTVNPGKPEICLYARATLWRMDTGSLGTEMESGWHQAGSVVSQFQDGFWENVSETDLWASRPASIFTSCFQFSRDDALTNPAGLMNRFTTKQLQRKRSETVQSGDIVQHRSVSADGKTVVINTIFQGDVENVIRIDKLTDSLRKYFVKSIVFRGKQPWEIREGKLTVSLTNNLPKEIKDLASSRDEWVGSAANGGLQRKLVKLDASDSEFLASGKTTTESLFNWTFARIVGSGVLYFVSMWFCFKTVSVEKGS